MKNRCLITSFEPLKDSRSFTAEEPAAAGGTREFVHEHFGGVVSWLCPVQGHRALCLGKADPSVLTHQQDFPSVAAVGWGSSVLSWPSSLR